MVPFPEFEAALICKGAKGEWDLMDVVVEIRWPTPSLSPLEMLAEGLITTDEEHGFSDEDSDTTGPWFDDAAPDLDPKSGDKNDMSFILCSPRTPVAC